MIKKMKIKITFILVGIMILIANNIAISNETQKLAVQEKTNSISNNNDKIASPSEKIKNAQEFIIQIEAYLALNPGWLLRLELSDSTSLI
jgi:hypothetical protein